ncbi:MAG: hypothetical protein ACNA7W_04755 [Pseudomonadales bacterium]
MDDSFCYFRLRAEEGGWQALAEGLEKHTRPRWEQAGIQCWGVWQGLLGIASNELLLMAAAHGERPAADFGVDFADGATVEDCLLLRATARPEGIEPLHAEGLYVLRFFEAEPRNFDEMVALSTEAWETFEPSALYQARPQGLFRPAAVEGDVGRMLLVTWYDGFLSWETSRLPAPQAQENFRKRQRLTRSTVAYATRLLL